MGSIDELKNIEHSSTDESFIKKAILDTFPLKAYVLDINSNKIIFSNFRYEPQEGNPVCCHKLVYNIKSPCDMSNKDCPLNKLTERGKPFYGRCIKWSASYNYRLPEMYCVPLLDENGKAKYLVEYLVESPFANEIYEHAINAMQLGLCIYKMENLDDDKSLRIIASNQFSTEVTGINPEDKLGKFIDDVFPHLRNMGIPQELARVVNSGEVCNIESACHIDEERKDKTILRVKAYPLPDDCVGVVFEDITEKQIMFELLQKREILYNHISRSAHDAIIMMDENEKIYYWNRAAERIFGYSRDEAIGKECHRLITPERYMESVRQGLEHFFKSGTGNAIGDSLELWGKRKNGEEIAIEISLSAIPVDNKWHAISIIRDRTKQLEAREIQSKLVRQYTELINAVHAEMYIKDRDLNFIVVNKALCDAVGKHPDEIIGNTIHNLVPPDKAEVYHKDDLLVRESGEEVINSEIQYINTRGESIWYSNTKIPIFDNNGEFAGIIGLHQDVTDIHLSRQKLMQSEKLAAIGTLAAGVAHEINNPMGYISSNLNTMSKYIDKIDKRINQCSDSLPDNEITDIKEIMIDFKDAIVESQEGAQRVKKIVSDLKSFSRIDKSELEHADINEGIETTLNIVWNELKYNCKVDKNYGELPDTLCNLNQLNQVFMNLLVNASHSIAHKEGLITITTWAKMNNIYISIKDNGSGIPEENLSKIFEPFFTTKDVGKGTGLGLSLVFDIIGKHDGKIDVKSELGVGSEFIIELPVRGE